ncbi:MAG TPA: CdaR family protein [Thermoanaerobaculia bacterium]
MLRLLFGNFWMKTTAFLLAAIIWTVVSAQRREQTGEAAFDVALALVGVPRDLVITNIPIPDTVNVRLRGPLSALRSLSSQTFEAALDLSGLRAGEFDIAIRPQSLRVPPGVEVLSIDPPKIRLRFEPRRQKRVPIRPYTVGQLPAGFAEGDVKLEPDTALVSGPASVIRDVSEVATDRLILSGRMGPFRANVSVVSDNPLVRVIEPASTIVTVDVIDLRAEEALTTTDSTSTNGSDTIGTPHERSDAKSLRNGRDPRKGTRVPSRSGDDVRPRESADRPPSKQ